MFSGPLELAVVAGVALLVFGPKRLPELAKAMGKGIRDFKLAVQGVEDGKDGAGSSGKSDKAIDAGGSSGQSRQ